MFRNGQFQNSRQRSGGTGFIGRNLRDVLLKENYKVTVVSRVRTGEEHIINWDELIKIGIPNDVTAVVNLTGEPILTPMKYFGNAYKKRVWISRIGSTMLLGDMIKRMKCKPDAFIVVTSTNMYPVNSLHSENYFPNNLTNCNFFTKLGYDWEKAMQCKPNEIRSVSIRTGTVLGDDGGFNKWLKNIAYTGFLTKIGDGHQYQPWIHLSDLIYLIIYSIETKKVKGVLNGVSPNRITNEELTIEYAHLLEKQIKEIPRIVLKSIYGTERTQLLLEGRQVLPTRTLSYGFRFEFNEIKKALNHLLHYKVN